VVYDPLLGDLKVLEGTVAPGKVLKTEKGDYTVKCPFAWLCADKPKYCLGCGNVFASKES
jgi:hypothetical protein